MLLQKRMEGFGDKTKIGLLREKPEKYVFGKPLDWLCSQRTWVLWSDLASNHYFEDCNVHGELLLPNLCVCVCVCEKLR